MPTPTAAKTVIHLVTHAHLDPIWLWPWTSGLDEAIATARSACDRLDAHADLFYTQGEAWTLAMVERADPALFTRIRAHVAGGRWELVNGWWCQPDCNLPTAAGMRKQIAIGLAWIHDRFGVAPDCGYNPDSFGHAAWLPKILAEFGQKRYVFMRPQEHEMVIPNRLFRWRSPGGAEDIATYRIAATYNNTGNLGPLRQALTDLPPGLGHAMAMIGMGDHGGGPTERSIQWLRDHAHDLENVELRFSTVGRFFDAVAPAHAALAVVEGELQQHAIGCYTVVRAPKQAQRRAEHALDRAGIAVPAASAKLDQAWQAVCAHQFHDTLGGSCLPSAYQQVENDLGGAAALADDELAYAARRRALALPGDPRPRLVLANLGAPATTAWVDIETYVEGKYVGKWRLLDETGAEVPFQDIEIEAIIEAGWTWDKRRVLVKLDLPENGLRALRMDLDTPRALPPAQVDARAEATGTVLAAVGGPIGGGEVRLRAGEGGPELRLASLASFAPVILALTDDPSDTWAHGCDRYADGGVTPSWGPARIVDRGPLMASAIQEGSLGRSSLRAEWRVHAGDPGAELLLDVLWLDQHKVLKLVVPGGGARERQDGVLGGPLTRRNDGREMPLQDWTALPHMAIACPDVFALDATPVRLRLTLLRAPLMAHHEPHRGKSARGRHSDQGWHRFRFRFGPGGAAGAAAMAAAATAWMRPALLVETTHGMGPRDA
jgi:alpha-mannosidase